MSREHSIEMRSISKSFAGVKALEKVNFEAQKGEIHALIGENGAGKSTLMKILAGAISRDEGSIFINGIEQNINKPRDAIRLGISVIYQEFMLSPHLTVAENIFIDNISGNKFFINWKELKEKARVELEKLGFSEIDPGTKVMSISVAYQQVVEICKCLTRKTNILVLDEPTAVLTFSEIEKLFEILIRLKNDGVTVIYISHRIDEIFRIADRVTILKDGCNVDTLPVAALSKNQLVTMMVGRELTQFFLERHSVIGKTILAVNHLKAGSMVKDVSFYIRAGEVVGFSGLVGAGRTETMRALFGADPIQAGEVNYMGEKINFKDPKDSIQHKFGLVSEDRKKEGLLLFQSIRVNATMTSINRVSKLGLLLKKKEQQVVKKLLESLSTKYGSIDDDVKSLSGGNQQKVALAKWVFAECRCIVFDEPTRGVDVGAKIEIYRIINHLAENGVAVIMVSSEMPEIIGMCDRAYVMRQGVAVGEVQKKDFSEEVLIKLAMGV